MILVAGASTAFEHAASGSLILAIPVAFIAGLVSFLSPCVLPLVPAYLSYVTGLSAADLAADTHPVSDGPGAAVLAAAHPGGSRRGRVLLVTGEWNTLSIHLRNAFPGFTTAV
jgi:cytochrome c biogenesis protein CcdA